MSVYQILWVSRKCDSCGCDTKTPITFQGEDDYHYEHHELGATVSPTTGLLKGRQYSGRFNPYCERCTKRWHSEYQESVLESLLELAEQGRVEVIARGNDVPLATQQIEAILRASILGTEGRTQSVLDLAEIFEFGFGNRRTKVICDNEPDSAWEGLLGEWYPRIHSRMRERGWDQVGPSILRECLVFVDQGGRIRYEVGTQY